jgi:hypothetical protein
MEDMVGGKVVCLFFLRGLENRGEGLREHEGTGFELRLVLMRRLWAGEESVL